MTNQTIFKEKKGISFEVLWKKYWRIHFPRELGKLKAKNFQYILGINLAIFDVILIDAALNSNHFSLCIMNFCVRIRWRAIKYKAVPMPKTKQKVRPVIPGKRR